MYLREATARDLHRLTEISITPLKDDPAFDFMWRYRKEYPEDNFFFWQQTLQSWLYDKKNTFIVMVLHTSNGDAEILSDTIISYAIWVRQGNSKVARQRWGAKNNLSNRIDALTTRVEIWSTGRKYKRRDADFARLAAIHEMGKAIEEKFWKDLPERWLLELMVTHVDFRRRGAATELLKVTYSTHYRSHLAGFQYNLAPFKVSAEGQTEELEIWAMRRDPGTESHQDRTSN